MNKEELLKKIEDFEEAIEIIAKGYVVEMGDYWSYEDGIPDRGQIEDFAKECIRVFCLNNKLV